MGYDRPLTDPYQIVLQQMKDDAQAAREALTPGGTQPFQTVRKVLQLLQDLLELVARLPQVESAKQVETGFGLSDVTSGVWKTVAEVTLTSPADKNRVVVQASAQGTVLDQTSAGLTSSNCRLLINGVASAELPASKDAGASVVANVLVVSDVLEITPLVPTVTVQFQMSPLNPSAFPADPANIANLTVYAGYSVV